VSDLLLEIGCENLPPAAIRPAFEQLKRDVAARLVASRLPCREIYATGAPRRIVLIVYGLASRQTSKTETVTGPPVSKAYDADGKPTPAAMGFAKSHGVAVSSLARVATERGEYVGFARKLPSQPAAVVLKTAVPEWIAGLRFPRLMRWESEGVRFARPIRWLVCVLGGSPIRVEIAGVRSAPLTYTVPWVHPRGTRVRNASHYLAVTRRSGIVLDHETRAKKIARLAREAAARRKLELVDDPTLVDELSFMLEDPRPLVGEFDRKYLDLPAEVVVTAMRSHQRYFAFRRRGGALAPLFLTFSEGRVGRPDVVRRGNEMVLRARLEDAFFYWREDLKTRLDGLAQKLSTVVFIEGLGTLRDKADRVLQLANTIAGLDRSGPPVAGETLSRAALLAKADLASEMIKDGKEFTRLQGVIGSHYARESGEPEEIAVALREQYLPRFAGDSLPQSRLGLLLAMSDRIDTIAGCFLAGVAPTGSEDPYGLRRQANGLMRMLESSPSVPLEPLLDQALRQYETAKLATAEQVSRFAGELIEFFKQRSAAFLKDSGITPDIVSAVSAVAWGVPGAALERARAFEALRGDRDLELLVTGAKRVGNILDPSMKLRGVGWPELKEAFLGSGALRDGVTFDAAAFDDAAETRLADAVRAALPRLARHEEASDAPAALRALAALGPLIDEYFVRVLVNCPDPALRTNRHGFLAAVFALFSRFADFSHLAEQSKALVR
jgi:glycyl-tRNA synthetase beta chain